MAAGTCFPAGISLFSVFLPKITYLLRDIRPEEPKTNRRNHKIIPKSYNVTAIYGIMACIIT